ncbi:sulfurtransferase [Pseudogracilibacillus sp. SE30717A]|uniref:sulfurtransferase n=1 Tax=Pseudogracilibacillus sp. SE30717A TaxID=3098293 RepID=UPI00300DC8E5
MTYIMTPTELKEKSRNNNLVIIDVRSNLTDPDQGEALYKEGHIPGAYYLHLEKDLSGEVKKHGGNHPLPDVEIFAGKLGKMGIDESSSAVIYDAKNDMFAARAWWLLYYMGHESCYVLDGGYTAWKNAGYDVTKEIPTEKNAHFTPRLRKDIVVDMHEVKHRDKQKSLLIDSRARDRYLGKTEPLYKKAGHIPGAKNYFWQEVLDESGQWKNVEQLKEHFSSLKDSEDIIVSCGSGISACPNFIALKMAGYHHVKLYPGSFSDWISYEDNPIETVEE